MKQKTYYISGMHCASCELLIEKRVLKEKGVRSVDASLSNCTLKIEYDGAPPSLGQLNDWFKSDGYVFSETQKKQDKEPLFYFEEGKQGIQVDKVRLKKKMKTVLSIVLIVLVLMKLEQSGLAQYVNVNDSSSLGLFFLFGLVAGLSSCAALVGGLLLSLTKNWNEQYAYDAPIRKKLIPHVYFHGGRLLAYTVLGGILGGIGRVVAYDNVVLYALITIAVSLVMLLIGLQMAGVEWAQKWQIRLPKFLTRNISQANSEKQLSHVPFSIGAGTVLLPCGFTLVAQGIALTSGSIGRGALMMLLFVLGTMIPLLFIGFISIKGSANPQRSRTFSFYVGVVLVLFALYNTNAQLNVLGLPSVSDVFAKQETTKAQQPTKNVAGQQVVTMVAKGFEYTLTSVATIQAGVSTKLVVDDQGMRGCGRYIAARGLMKGYTVLEPGENVIDLGKPKPGTYKITCSMGMVPPVTLIVK